MGWIINKGAKCVTCEAEAVGGFTSRRVGAEQMMGVSGDASPLAQRKG